jgi:hypothetical protein
VLIPSFGSALQLDITAANTVILTNRITLMTRMLPQLEYIIGPPQRSSFLT